MLPWLIVYETKKYVKFQMIMVCDKPHFICCSSRHSVRDTVILSFCTTSPWRNDHVEPLSKEFKKYGIWEDLEQNRDLVLGFRWFDTSHLSFENLIQKESITLTCTSLLLLFQRWNKLVVWKELYRSNSKPSYLLALSGNY